MESFLVEDFTEMHTTKVETLRCSSCQRKFDADKLSAKFFQDDLSGFMKLHRPWYSTPLFKAYGRNIKGAISGAYIRDEEKGAKFDFGFILETILYHPDRPMTRPHLALYANSAKNPNWGDIMSSIKKTTDELKAARILRLLSRPGLFKSLEIAYRGIVWRDLSIDLVAAALRQREFSKKITGASCRALDSPEVLFKATTRYHKFLLLIKRKANQKGGKNGLVPTLDIDLCWHTHQLAAHSYRQWCIEHLGLAINHDDSIGEKSLNSGLRETSLAWYDAYRQSYVREDLSEVYTSKSRTMAGVLIPLYGLFVRNKGKKLKQAQMGHHLTILPLTW
jgi:hypothetical protein